MGHLRADGKIFDWRASLSIMHYALCMMKKKEGDWRSDLLCCFGISEFG